MSQNDDQVWGPSEAKEKKEGKKIWRWVVLGGCVVMFIPMVAIMAAIALPMYSTFKQKGKVSTVLKSAYSTKPALEAWYADRGYFTGLDVPAHGGAIRAGDLSAGAGLPEIQGVNWSMDGDAAILSLRFNFQEGSGCPPSACDGVWMLDCTEQPCKMVIRVGENDMLGLNLN